MKIFFAFLLSLCPVLAFAQEPTAEQALNTVVESEGKFAQMSQEQNTRAAFLEYLAADAIVFRPGPVNGQELWKKRPENYIAMSWKPLLAGIARSADLAYTTGPAEWREKKEDPKPYGYAQFVSIWKKQKDGAWKVTLDVGNEVPGPIKGDEAPQLELSLPNETSNAAADLAAAKSKLQQAETQFATAAKADSTIALAEAGNANMRVHREGVFPAIGKGAASLMLSVRRGKLSLDRSGGGISAAGDLAYSYGKYSLVKPQETERGHYLQIWRTEADGSWKIALDYQAPLPPEAKK